MIVIMTKTKAKNTLCLIVYVCNLFYYYILKQKGMTSIKIILASQAQSINQYKN